MLAAQVTLCDRRRSKARPKRALEGAESDVHSRLQPRGSRAAAWPALAALPAFGGARPRATTRLAVAPFGSPLLSTGVLERSDVAALSGSCSGGVASAGRVREWLIRSVDVRGQ